MKQFLFIFLAALTSAVIFSGCTKKDKTVPVSSIVLSEAVIDLTAGEKQVIKAYISPSDATEQTVTWASSNASVATVSSDGEVTAVALGTAQISASCDGKTGECTINVVALKAVDMGLSVKWADRNVGAKSPEDYGDYFAWGETEPKPDYSWATYKFCNGTSNSLTKYNSDSNYGTVDNKLTLLQSDDVAHEKIGGKWRMPTWDDIEELLENTDWSPTTVNGVKGFRITSLKNRNSIFLPSAGGIEGNTPRYVGTNALYWGSQKPSDEQRQAIILFTDEDEDYDFAFCYRHIGLPVRAVTK